MPSICGAIEQMLLHTFTSSNGVIRSSPSHGGQDHVLFYHPVFSLRLKNEYGPNKRDFLITIGPVERNRAGEHDLEVSPKKIGKRSGYNGHSEVMLYSAKWASDAENPSSYLKY